MTSLGPVGVAITFSGGPVGASEAEQKRHLSSKHYNVCTTIVLYDVLYINVLCDTSMSMILHIYRYMRT